jgi:hypothetical protein
MPNVYKSGREHHSGVCQLSSAKCQRENSKCKVHASTTLATKAKKAELIRNALLMEADLLKAQLLIKAEAEAKAYADALLMEAELLKAQLLIKAEAEAKAHADALLMEAERLAAELLTAAELLKSELLKEAELIKMALLMEAEQLLLKEATKPCPPSDFDFSKSPMSCDDSTSVPAPASAPLSAPVSALTHEGEAQELAYAKDEAETKAELTAQPMPQLQAHSKSPLLGKSLPKPSPFPPARIYLPGTPCLDLPAKISLPGSSLDLSGSHSGSPTDPTVDPPGPPPWTPLILDPLDHPPGPPPWIPLILDPFQIKHVPPDLLLLPVGDVGAVEAFFFSVSSFVGA